MGFYTEQVLPRLTDIVLGRPMEEVRARVSATLAGDVLEIGFGSGRNLPHLPPDVTRLLAVEPAAGGRALAARRIAAAGVPVAFVGADARELGLPDGSVDHVLVSWSLCTIPDVDVALGEVRRVLRPGGALHFVEHGRSSNRRVARWQDRLTPLWSHAFGGCHLNRPVDRLITEAGLQLDHLRTYRFGRPELVGFAYEGTASKPAGAAPAAR